MSRTFLALRSSTPTWGRAVIALLVLILTAGSVAGSPGLAMAATDRGSDADLPLSGGHVQQRIRLEVLPPVRQPGAVGASMADALSAVTVEVSPPVAGRHVELQRRSGVTWRRAGTAATDKNGQATFFVASGSAHYREWLRLSVASPTRPAPRSPPTGGARPTSSMSSTATHWDPPGSTGFSTTTPGADGRARRDPPRPSRSETACCGSARWSTRPPPSHARPPTLGGTQSGAPIRIVSTPTSRPRTRPTSCTGWRPRG